MKILKNSTYEGMCQEIEDGKKKIQSLTEQFLAERNKYVAALKEKQDAQKNFDTLLKYKSDEIERLNRLNAALRDDKAFFEKEMNQAKEELAKLVAENAQLKKQTAERKPQRTSNGRFAKKKDNE